MFDAFTSAGRDTFVHSNNTPMPPCPSFDAWSVIFLIAAVQGLFIALILFRWQRGDRAANRLLAAIMLLFSLTLLEYVLYWSRCWREFPHVADSSLMFPVLFGPLLWFYLRMIYLGKKISGKDAWHFIPFLAGVVLMLPWYFLDAEGKKAIFSGQSSHPVPVFVLNTLTIVRIVHMFAYAVWNAVFISRQPRIGATTRWAWTLDAFFAGFALSYTTYFVLAWVGWLNPQWDYQISASMTAFIYLIAYAGYVQPAVFEGYRWNEPNAPVKYRNSGLTPEASRSLLQNLQLYMQQERAYHDPDISLDKLAAALNASKHHVSQIINEHLGASFFEYVNQLRVEEAKSLLAETTRNDLHVIEVAYAVGFNNKVSFNAAFKKATGMTPTEYRRSHSQSDSGSEKPGTAEGGR
jgi:AraC-like DNA-binding protein